MTDRSDLADNFLADTPWSQAQRSCLAGDASNRRYDRLTNPGSGKTAVFMDAPPDRGEDVRPFVRIARYLKGLGLSAPAILAEDNANGFLVIEDLGDALFARAIPNNPPLESTLYKAAIDVLLTLHTAPLPELDRYDTAPMTDLAALAFTKYRTGILGDAAGEDQFRALFTAVLSEVEPYTLVLIQRDYHAENLLWLPDRQGVARVGLLDFQDAMAGHPAYDLVSLLQDARRDVPETLETDMVARYLAGSGLDPARFKAAYAILGTQRNLRILGVFARLGCEFGKPHYIDLIPRVWALLQRDLRHPALAQVASLLAETLPGPTIDALARLKLQ